MLSLKIINYGVIVIAKQYAEARRRAARRE